MMRNNDLLLIKKAIIFMICIVFIMSYVSCDNKLERDELNMEKISKIYIVKSEIAKKLYPADYNIEKAKEKGLSNTSLYEPRFLLIQSGYRAILNEFLCEYADLDKYQSSLDKNELNFPKGLQTEFSKIGAFGRNNIYIRNSLYVERLSREDIKLILDSIDGKKIKIDDKLISMVERTWKEIITVQLNEEEYTEPYEIVYDEYGINKKLAFNDALVFELAYNVDFDSEGNIVNKEKEKAKYKYATELASKMEVEISSKLNCHVSVIIKN